MVETGAHDLAHPIEGRLRTSSHWIIKRDNYWPPRPRLIEPSVLL